MATAVALLATVVFFALADDFIGLLKERLGESPSPWTIVGAVKLLLIGVVGYLFVRALNSLLFGLALRLKRFDAPTLIRNIFSIVAFSILFLIAYTVLFPKVNLGVLFTTSAIFGVILGLAFQDTPRKLLRRNIAAGGSPFQVGDVITVGPHRHTGGRRDHLASSKDSDFSKPRSHN